jgi:hypothetical protein
MSIGNTLLYLQLTLRALSAQHKVRVICIPTLHDGFTAQTSPEKLLKLPSFRLEAKATQLQIIHQLQIAILPIAKATIDTNCLQCLLQLLSLLIMPTR